MLDQLELEDEEFEQLIADRRHKELLSAINKLLSAINVKEDSTAVTKELQKQSQAIREFSDTIKNLKQPIVNVNQEPVISAIKNLSIAVKTELDLIKQSLGKEKEEKEWEFDIKRDFTGNITKVTATEL